MERTRACRFYIRKRDGKVNVRDAAFIAAKLAQGKSGELPANADFNGDGKVNVRDAAAIAKYLATGNIDPQTKS